MAAVDSGGRVADNVVLRTLAWGPGTALDLEIRHGLVVIHATARGTSAVTPQGFLRLSVSLRRRLDLHAGDRVLLAAYPDHQLLIVHPPIALDDLLAPAHAPLLGGDPA
ncbi:AbrB/MazE/SpoVT family DNA-binding domain-containing protein [Umezawaea sp. NPDC059074]|uniref:AbrB/MazE/SpoVT family DNA-binding domain-containing protein n=1 Tax=Umezawaea sp. NPDC059074 TaxID=3346716 RepID=UPI0036C89381